MQKRSKREKTKTWKKAFNPSSPGFQYSLMKTRRCFPRYASRRPTENRKTEEIKNASRKRTFWKRPSEAC